MPTPDSSTEEIRTSTLLYLRMYEEGKLTLNDLATELAVMTAAYRHAIGSLEDEFASLLDAALTFKSEEQRLGWAEQHDFELAVTEFRRAVVAWE
jgi:hypothetical protein